MLETKPLLNAGNETNSMLENYSMLETVSVLWTNRSNIINTFSKPIKPINISTQRMTNQRSIYEQTDQIS